MARWFTFDAGDSRIGMILSWFGLAFVAASPFLYIGWLWLSDLSACDAAIGDQLKAPATYKRVFARSQGNGEYQITYDAQNSFGVPLRGKGICTIDRTTGVATFDEMNDVGAP